MGDDAFLRRAICAAPFDDAPRLAHADWLDEHGQPERAEFVRAQCRLNRLMLGAFKPIGDAESVEWRREVRALADRQAVLFKLHGRDWLGAWQDLIRVPGPDDPTSSVGLTDEIWDGYAYARVLGQYFHRGYVFGVDFIAPDLLVASPGAFAGHPIVQVHVAGFPWRIGSAYRWHPVSWETPYPAPAAALPDVVYHAMIRPGESTPPLGPVYPTERYAFAAASQGVITVCRKMAGLKAIPKGILFDLYMGGQACPDGRLARPRRVRG